MRKEWTEGEITYLKRRYLVQPVRTTAVKLDRSEVSVKNKARRLGLSHYNDELNAKTVASCFGCDISVVIRWIKKFGLPCKKVHCSSQIRYIIDTDKFWKWGEENKNIINWSKYEKRSLCPEPDWLKEEISKYTGSKRGERYTEAEKNKIRTMLKRGYTHKQIAEETNRTYNGISHLCRKIF